MLVVLVSCCKLSILLHLEVSEATARCNWRGEDGLLLLNKGTLEEIEKQHVAYMTSCYALLYH